MMNKQWFIGKVKNEDTFVNPSAMRDLVGVIMLLGIANNMPMKPVVSWPSDIGYDWQQLNEQSSKLTLIDAEILVDGEDVEAAKIVEKYKIPELHEFLNAAFDGHLNEIFYYS